MTYLDVEKKLVLFLAELLSLAPDREIFAGELPEGIDEGITLSLAEGLPATHSRPNTFKVLINGTYHCRREVRQKAYEITASLPVFGKAGLLSVCMDENEPLKFSSAGEPVGSLHRFVLCLAVAFI